jgi:methylmalonyl-CoA/ethylmalonyl-CoA epimerase
LERVLRLEHIGIAVEDVETMTRVLSEVLGRRPYKAETVSSEGVRTLFLNAGGAKLELLESTSQDSPIAGFLKKRGAGMHHLAFEVADLDGEIARLETLGYEVLGKARPGADGKRIVFLHPRSTGRVLIELCQQVDFPTADTETEPAPTSRINVLESPLSGALTHALGRYFCVEPSPSPASVGAIRVGGSAGAPHIVLSDAAAGDLEIRISTDQIQESGSRGARAVSAGAGCVCTIPAHLWRGLPDPWGLLADLVAVHVRGD